MSLERASLAAVEYIYELVEELEIPSLEEQGVSPDLIPRLAEEAYKDPQTTGNPRDIDVKGYQQIYLRCFDMD
jgi:choline dehydrogenase